MSQSDGDIDELFDSPPPPGPDLMFGGGEPAKAAPTATQAEEPDPDDDSPPPIEEHFPAVVEEPKKPSTATSAPVEDSRRKGEYRVIALKYRPQTFDDLVGQEHIKQALTNAINRDKVAHAFLFAGSRGTGKTTTARILAKALNCLSGSGPTAEPCGTCVACREIADSRDMDVLEIDGASNNGVEQIRELRGSIENRPARDRYRVVIIDEVHMLSVAAFNALLKTLEEPPRHVKFIFATTDPHKVPETIHSRCQHYDFRRLSAAEISSCLRDIAKREGVNMGQGVPEALAAIAEGGMRDAQSRLDQLIAFRGNQLEVRDIEQVFGLVSRQGMLKLVQSLRARDPSALFSFVEDAFSSGKDLAALVAGMTRLFRDLMIIRASGGKAPGLDLLPGEEQLLSDEARLWPQEALLLAVDLLSACGLKLKSAEFPRFVLESSLLKLSELGNLRPVDDLISALDAVLRHGGNQNLPPSGDHPSPKAQTAGVEASPAPAAERSAPSPTSPPQPETRTSIPTTQAIPPKSDPRVLDVEEPAVHQALVESAQANARASVSLNGQADYSPNYDDSPEDSPNFDETIEPAGGATNQEEVEQDESNQRRKGPSASVKHAARLAREVFGLSEDA